MKFVTEFVMGKEHIEAHKTGFCLLCLTSSYLLVLGYRLGVVNYK